MPGYLPPDYIDNQAKVNEAVEDLYGVRGLGPFTEF